jgi:hypothetical protein
MDVSDDDIARLSPLIWRHLNFLGEYDFLLPDNRYERRSQAAQEPYFRKDF